MRILHSAQVVKAAQCGHDRIDRIYLLSLSSSAFKADLHIIDAVCGGWVVALAMHAYHDVKGMLFGLVVFTAGLATRRVGNVIVL